MTRWAADVSPENVLSEYPRPQMTREDWLNLNGLWEYAVTPRNASRPAEFPGEILVPFAIESALSGVGESVSPTQALWYRRTITIPEEWSGRRILLHFGAADWEATVFLNGLELRTHRGGYTPFSVDLTRALAAEGEQELIVRVWDPTDMGTQPRGKQTLEPQGIWYTAVTGIWQTVWLEPLPERSIERLTVTPDLENGETLVEAVLSGPSAGLRLRAAATYDGAAVAEAVSENGSTVRLAIADPLPWSPDAPNLYDLRVELLRDDETVDRVESYFAMRKIALAEDASGALRLELNNEPLFHLGPLDQGWWPDGLYTAPTDEALAYDIEATKELGFNMARKHVKVEPARWYYHCDRLGLLVWQDMPSGFLGGRGPRSLFVGPFDREDAPRDGVSAAQFEAELAEMIETLRFFPSIVMWVPFNEGWGQYDTERIADWVAEQDPTRLVNAASGWTDRNVGDVYDTHIYPGPGMQFGGSDRAAVLGEFGGLGWPVEDHLWWNKRNWGYRTYSTREELNARYAEVWSDVVGPYSRGLAAAIYTQTTDVEGEVNGLMSYDRAIVKFDAERTQQIHAPFYEAPPTARILVPTSLDEQQTWSYTFEEPADGWTAFGFNASSWKTGEAPFRSALDLDFPTGAAWTGDAIWIRRTFELEEVPSSVWLEMQHTVSAGAVYINGTKVDELEGRTRREYRHRDLSEHLGALQVGPNVLAIHARVGQPEREGRRDLDAGLYAVK